MARSRHNAAQGLPEPFEPERAAASRREPLERGVTEFSELLHPKRKKQSMQTGAAAAGAVFQRVTHRNRQVSVLVVVASAALAAAVYDAALATSLAASLAAALASAALPAEIVAAT